MRELMYLRNRRVEKIISIYFPIIMITEEDVSKLLKEVNYPGFSRDIVSFGLVKGIEIKDKTVSVSLAVTTTDPQIPAELKQSVDRVLLAHESIDSATIRIAVTKPKNTESTRPDIPSMQAVKTIVAIASGKGGVGKSSVTTNLACALDKILSAAGRPNRVGIMDCDIYGPSIPLMMGANVQPQIEDNMIIPIENFGIRMISMGFLIDEDTPVVWRGPMITKTIQQFAMNVSWGKLDVLLVDLPPGTGDAQLSLVQTLPLNGALIITTPQTAAVNVARRGATMFAKVDVPLLGVVENMSYFDGADGKRVFLFGSGGGQKAATYLNTPLLASIPLEPALREGSDRGIPLTISHPDNPATIVFMGLAKELLNILKLEV